MQFSLFGRNLILKSFGRTKWKQVSTSVVSQTRLFSQSVPVMAKSRFEYVKQFEVDDRCLHNCWIVVRLDGKGFHRFSDSHTFTKPNDERSLNLMTCAAEQVMKEFKEVVISYGQSDEYSFVFRRDAQAYNRRASKLMSNVVSLFTSSFVFNWKQYFPTLELKYPPVFDGRAVLYPTNQNLRDYLSWRQADCHINNLYNTCFWALVQDGGLSRNDAQERLKGTVSGEKNELLFTQFGINYNELPELYRKGTVLVRERIEEVVTRIVPTKDGLGDEERQFKKFRQSVNPLHVDIIGKAFWEEHPAILGQEG